MSGLTSLRDSTKLLPVELVAKVLDDLKSEEIVAMSQTCRRLRTIASAHMRFWHTCYMLDHVRDLSLHEKEHPSARDKSYLRTQRRRFVKRARRLAALDMPIGIFLRFHYDIESLSRSDSGSDDDGGDLFHDNIPVPLDGASLIQFALSAAITPSVVSLDLSFGHRYAVSAYDALAHATMPTLRHLGMEVNLDCNDMSFIEMDALLRPIPKEVLCGGAPQLRDLYLTGYGVSFGVGPQTTTSIPAFTNITTATLNWINLLYMHNLALYLPNIIHLTLCPMLMYDEMTIPADYLHDKHITPFSTSLKTLHVDCLELEEGFTVTGGCESDKRYPILAQLIHGMVPHLRTISVSGLSEVDVEDGSVLLIDNLVGALARSVQLFKDLE